MPVDVAPSRLEAAKAEGRRLIEGMRLGDELAIIAAGAQPRVVCGPTDHERTLRAALESITPSDGPTRVDRGRRTGAAAALRLREDAPGRRPLRRRLRRRRRAGPRGRRRADLDLGKKTGNVGITRLQARRSLLDPIGYEILVEVANASDEPASFRLELDLDDDPIDVVPLNSGRRANARCRSSRRPRPKAAGSARHDRPRRYACRPITPPGRSSPAAPARR